MPPRHASRVHGVSGFASRARALRRVPCRIGRELVREVQTLGPRQVYYTALGTYPWPIPTPAAEPSSRAANLRTVPLAEEVLGRQLKAFTHYGTDEQNTPRVIRMLIKTGAAIPRSARPAKAFTGT